MESVAIVIPCIPRDLPYLGRAVKSAVRQRGQDNLVVTRVADAPLAVNLNALIAGTTAEYIVRLDADDYLAPHAVQTLLGNIGNAPMLYARHYFVDDWDVISSGHWIDPNNPLGASCIFRRDAWERLGGYDETLQHQEATDFYLRMEREIGRVKWIDEPVYYYCKRPGSLSSNVKGVRAARERLGLLPE